MPNRRRPLRSVLPPDGSSACPAAAIGAYFRLNRAMQYQGERYVVLNLAVFALTVDGVDVSGKLEGGPVSMAVPGSLVHYRPEAPLATGRHQAVISFPGKEGAAEQYAWSFEVQPVPCADGSPAAYPTPAVSPTLYKVPAVPPATPTR